MKVCCVHLSINWKILLHSLSSRMKLGIRFCSQVIFMGIIGIKLPKKAYYLGIDFEGIIEIGLSWSSFLAFCNSSFLLCKWYRQNLHYIIKMLYNKCGLKKALIENTKHIFVFKKQIFYLVYKHFCQMKKVI